MNFIAFSPHFPPNYARFWESLRGMGATVLGLADEPYESLSQELRGAMTEYYRVDDLHNYDQLVRALGYFTHRYGKIDRIESHNEYWLETEAYLRTDFNIFGINNDGISRIKRKSEMKKVYTKAGIAVARGRVVRRPSEAEDLIAETGYPVVAKPDNGVGANLTFKIRTPEDLERFWQVKPPTDYIMEEFIQGDIHSFDGLTDRDGNIVFYTAHVFSQGILETVNQDMDIFYYSMRTIPEDLDLAGRAVLKAFGIRERFFHLEFFRTRDGKLVALEVNMRPPGGLTTDMFNYANDIDIYREYASVVINNRFDALYSRPFHCCYVGRKFITPYLRSHEEILSGLGEKVVHHQPISGAFAPALGSYGYLVRSPDLEEVKSMATYILEKGG